MNGRVLGAVLLALGLGIAWAPASVTSALRIAVVDDTSRPIPGARVLVTPAAGGIRHALTTSAGGTARIDGLAPGEYQVEARAPGYGPSRLERVVVVLDTTTDVRIALMPGLTEEVSVVADPRSADINEMSVGLLLDADLIDAVPTFREYQDQFRLVPGAGTGRSPRVHGATERDNLYLIDGVNTTDPRDGNIGLEINSEIVEQQVALTGALGAQYGSAVGMVSNLVTRSGGSRWSGFANAYRRDSDWSAGALDGVDVSTDLTSWETSVGAGGPLIADRLTFFGSAMKGRERVRTITKTGEPRPDGINDTQRLSGKLTWSPNDAHRFELVAHDSDSEFLNANASNLRVTADQFLFRDVPATSLALRHTAFLGPWGVVETQLGFHRQAVDRLPQVPEAGPSVWASGSRLRFGRHWRDNISERDRDQLSSMLTSWVHTDWGEHAIRAGVQGARTDLTEYRAASGGERFFDRTSAGSSLWSLFGPGGALFNRWQGFALENEDVTCLLGGLPCDEQSVDPGAFADPADWQLVAGGSSYTPLDFVFATPSVNDDAAALGWVRYERESASGTSAIDPVGNDVWAAFVQDEWRLGRWSARAGLRIERQSLRDSEGRTIFRGETTFAPRLGVGYALGGRWPTRLTAHWGRYYDPIRDNLVTRAGQLGAPRVSDELWAEPLAAFLRWDSSGGAGDPDTAVAPDFETPHTDELTLSAIVDLAPGSSLRLSLFRRRSRDVAETFDSLFGLGDPEIYPTLQSGPTLTSLGFGDVDGDGSVTEDDAGGRFIIYNPPNSRRDFEGLDLVYHRALARGWQLFASYSFTDDTGNIAGDAFPSPAIGVEPYWDPRFAYNEGPLPYSRDHVFRAYGSCRLPLSWTPGQLEIGGLVSWMSGTHYSLEGIETPDRGEPGIWNGDPARIVATLPIDRGEFSDFLGIPAQLPDGSPNPALDSAIVSLIPLDLRPGRGAYENPSELQIDLRFRYRHPISEGTTLELFIDVLNVTNRQRPTRREDRLDATGSAITPENVSERGSYAFQQTLVTQSPRRYFTGVRILF